MTSVSTIRSRTSLQLSSELGRDSSREAQIRWPQSSQDFLTFAFKVASLSALQRIAWEATVQALPVDTTSVGIPYSIVNMFAGTNCIKWTVEAAFAAVVASKIGN
jgi:hypothetical protein